MRKCTIAIRVSGLCDMRDAATALTLLGRALALLGGLLACLRALESLYIFPAGLRWMMAFGVCLCVWSYTVVRSICIFFLSNELLS